MFDFILTHKLGRQMGRPDALSRWADHLKGADDNMDLTLLTCHMLQWLLALAAGCVHMITQCSHQPNSLSQLSCIGPGTTPRAAISSTLAEISGKTGND